MALTKTNNWKVEKVFERAHKGPVNFISVHPSGKLALSIGSDMTLRTWNLINGRQAFVTSLKNKSLGNSVDFVMWSTTGDYFAIAGKDSVEVWDTNKASVLSSKKCVSRPTSLCWISDNDILVGMDDGKMMFFNWEDENEEANILEIYESRVKSMKFMDGFLATCSSAGELNLWKITTGDKVEMDMIAGVDVGCRLICLDIIEIDISIDGGDTDIKDETKDEVKTKVRQLKTSGRVTVEIDQDEEPAKKKKKNTPQQKKTKNTKVRFSNGFVEEDI
jgi:protein MAK11